LDKVGQSKIPYIGHSEGFTTMITALTTEQADWIKQRVSVLIGLAPISRLDHIGTSYLKILGYTDFAIALVRAAGLKEWFGNTLWTRFKFHTLCNYFPSICEFSLKYITDGDPSVNDRSVLRIYMGHFPGGLSVKILEHELQLFRAGKFQYFDYGAKKNMEVYGQETPDEIPVQNINNIPIAMFVGNSDLLGDVTDNQWLRDQLGDNVIFYKEYDYGCASFYIAKDMKYLNDLNSVLKQYTTTVSE